MVTRVGDMPYCIVQLQTKLKYFGASQRIILLWFSTQKENPTNGTWWVKRQNFCLHHLNIGSGYGLVPDGTKPLPEPMLTSGQSREISLNAISMEIFLISTTNIWKVYIYIFFLNFTQGYRKGDRSCCNEREIIRAQKNTYTSHCNDATWPCCLKSLTTQNCLFNSLFSPTTKKSKLSITGLLWGESWIPLTKGHQCENISISL